MVQLTALFALSFAFNVALASPVAQPAVDVKFMGGPSMPVHPPRDVITEAYLATRAEPYRTKETTTRKPRALDVAERFLGDSVVFGGPTLPPIPRATLTARGEEHVPPLSNPPVPQWKRFNTPTPPAIASSTHTRIILPRSAGTSERPILPRSADTSFTSSTTTRRIPRPPIPT